MGFNVFNFCIQDSPRRAHSIAAQGGINAAKNYQNDGDSVYRLFYDTIKGDDYRARDAFDAFIIQDMGMVRILQKHFPNAASVIGRASCRERV